MNYEEMSKKVLSMMVAKVVYGECISDGDNVIVSKKHAGENVISVSGVFSIDNPADMWPIIVENKIGLSPDPFKAGVWFSYDIDELNIAESTSPLRAAAIVFLEMNGVKPNV